MWYIKGLLKSKTAFMIGNGDSFNSDSDILKYSDGSIFIPGSTLAGVCRAYLEEFNLVDKETLVDKKTLVDKETIENLFGIERHKKDNSSKDMSENEEKQEEDTHIESSIIFYDALAKDAPFVNVRDSVRLEDKVSVPESKFDYEVAQGGSFNFEIVINCPPPKNNDVNKSKHLTEENIVKIINLIFDGFDNGDIRIGAKTSRGFGVFSLDNMRYSYLDLSNKEDMRKYIEGNFEFLDWGDDKTERTYDKKLTKGLYHRINKELKLKNFIFIRDYATTQKVEPYDKESKFVDTSTLTDGKADEEGNIVVPGTALAGAFRNHCRRILKKAKYKTEEERKAFLDKIFGYETPFVDGNLAHEDAANISKANVIFKETKIKKDKITMLNRTRTAIDRFTGSALNKALFTDRMAFVKDGVQAVMELEIKIRKDGFDSNDELSLVESLIDTCIADLSEGYLTIGGAGAIGGGIFEAEGKEA